MTLELIISLGGSIGAIISATWGMYKYLSKQMEKNMNLQLEGISKSMNTQIEAIDKKNETYKVEQNCVIDNNRKEHRENIIELFRKVNVIPETINNKLREYVPKEVYKDGIDNLNIHINNVILGIAKIEEKIEKSDDYYNSLGNTLARVEEKLNSFIEQNKNRN